MEIPDVLNRGFVEIFNFFVDRADVTHITARI
jgi:hypothetical protein